MSGGAVERYRVYLRDGPKHGTWVHVDSPLPMELTVDDALYLFSSHFTTADAERSDVTTEYVYSGQKA